ncbi:acetylxylan esterase [Deinococcus yavapaiensis]|uniref:Cephalosporin-C deacetylase n=1 Tax=Deinococcus yavapaiensis KR-236 TaxID=694435 RepID=A0A318S0I0_9DEIO|nr:acetylxylan esterase [Deinococcus yavapaiensis]PYE50495.1 cephalosporin-C deacetylase [Deinococcus yavapaiensis KR-236]
MAWFDLSEAELRSYTPTVREPQDFDAFWADTLADAHAHPLLLDVSPVDTPLKRLTVHDVAFAGYAGQAVRAWLIAPRDAPSSVPCVVEYIGYGGGRGLPSDWLLYASAGYAHLVMDTRGQGSVWRRGDTPDPDPAPLGGQHPGFLTRGLLDPRTYYYRRVFTDAARAVQAARALPGVDAARIAVAGGSQGGGIALATAALMPDVSALLADVPFLCHFERAVAITNAQPYAELTGYLRTHRDRIERVFETLAYFDGVSFARRVKAPALFSVGLMDEVCPPSTVFAAFNGVRSAKDIAVYPYSGHEAGEGPHALRRLAFLEETWRTPRAMEVDA